MKEGRYMNMHNYATWRERGGGQEGHPPSSPISLSIDPFLFQPIIPAVPAIPVATSSGPVHGPKDLLLQLLQNPLRQRNVPYMAVS